MNYKRIIELLQQRAELDQLRAGFATTDTISIGDDHKRLVVLPISELKQHLNEVIDSERAGIDSELTTLGVRLG